MCRSLLLDPLRLNVLWFEWMLDVAYLSLEEADPALHDKLGTDSVLEVLLLDLVDDDSGSSDESKVALNLLSVPV